MESGLAKEAVNKIISDASRDFQTPPYKAKNNLFILFMKPIHFTTSLY